MIFNTIYSNTDDNLELDVWGENSVTNKSRKIYLHYILE